MFFAAVAYTAVQTHFIKVNGSSKNDLFATAAAQQLSLAQDCVESLSVKNSLFALSIAHCSQFEHSGDSTMQSYNV